METKSKQQLRFVLGRTVRKLRSKKRMHLLVRKLGIHSDRGREESRSILEREEKRC